MSFKPIDAKRDEYRKYLERTGVLEMLSKVIVKLCECPERPENAIDFIRRNMGDAVLERDTIEHLKQELEDSRNEVAQLKRQLEALRLENTKTSPTDTQSNAETVVEQAKDEPNEMNTSDVKPSSEKEPSEEKEIEVETSSDKEEKEVSNEKSSTNVQATDGNVESNASPDGEGKDTTAVLEPESNKE